MLYGLYWQEVFPWRTPEDETPECSSPVSGDHIVEVLDLQPGQILPYCFECLEGGWLDFAVSSLFPIDLFVCTGGQFEKWADLDFDATGITAFESRKSIRSTSLSFEIPRTDEYAAVLVNHHQHPVPIVVFARPIDPQAADTR
ncbi:MAG: hypothetical protein K2X03_08755 [Bryobacteraceae bacterium]|nr:hypothetical protein [Bryobacteraceae bacterium]